jgi:hypothetical protein
MSSIASNPKLNLTDEQKNAFQEVLNETTKEMSKEYAKTATLTMRNNNMLKAIGASSMNSSIYNNLLMSNIYGSIAGQTYSPYNGINSSLHPTLSNSSGYLNNFYNKNSSYFPLYYR